MRCGHFYNKYLDNINIQHTMGQIQMAQTTIGLSDVF